MKFLNVSLFCATFIAFNAIAQVPDVGAILRKFIEKARCQFQNGFSSLNIPSLDPLHIPSYQTALNRVGGLTNIMFVLLDTTVLGFGNFEFTKFDFSIPQASLTFGVTFPFFDFSGKHETAAEFKNQVIAGRGNFKILVKNVHVEVTVVVQAFPIKIKSHDVTNVTIGEVDATFEGFGSKELDREVSENLSQGAADWVKNNLPQLNRAIAAFFVDKINQLLMMFPDVNSILQAITGSDKSTA